MRDLVLILGMMLLISFACSETLDPEIPLNENCSYLLASNAPVESGSLEKMNYNQSYNQGVNDAAAIHSSSSWFLGGFGSGLMLGLIGAGVITIAAGGADPTYIPENADVSGYRAGYMKKSKSKNKTSAAVGGLLGTAVVVGLVLSAQ